MCLVNMTYLAAKSQSCADHGELGLGPQLCSCTLPPHFSSCWYKQTQPLACLLIAQSTLHITARRSWQFMPINMTANVTITCEAFNVKEVLLLFAADGKLALYPLQTNLDSKSANLHGECMFNAAQTLLFMGQDF